MRLVPLVFLLLIGCGDDGGVGPDAGSGADGSTAGDAATDAAPGCARTPAAADRTRYIVVSHPFAEGGGSATAWEVLSLSTSGVIATTGTTFEMGRGNEGRVAFTPDGEVGVADQDDGTLGIFTIDEGGAVTVVEAGWNGGDAFYAAGVVMAPDGARVYVLDSQWRENGGGIYAVALGCDGAPTLEGLVAAARLPYELVLAGDRALLAAADILDSAAGDDAHLIAWPDPEVVAGADAFADDEQIVSAAALTADGDYFLIGDNSAFSGLPNRVAVVRVDGDALAAVQTLSPVEDPVAIVASPTDDAALVVSGFGDAIFELDYDPANTAAPFTLVGELTYEGAGPQLPGAAVLIERGALAGHVFVAELLGVRALVFESGSVTDLGVTEIGTGNPAIVGAIGVQP